MKKWNFFFEFVYKNLDDLGLKFLHTVPENHVTHEKTIETESERKRVYVCMCVCADTLVCFVRLTGALVDG